MSKIGITAGGKYLSSDTLIRVIGSVEPEACTEMLRNLREKLGAKIPLTTLLYGKNCPSG